MAGQPRKATVLKILNGSHAAHPERRRDDNAVRPPGKPEAFDWLDLNFDERRMFDWLIETGALPAIHTRADSFMFANAAKLAVQLQKAQSMVEKYGQVMKHPGSGKPVVQPYFAACMQLNAAVARVFTELALTPAGRLRHAPPVTGPLTVPTSWDEIE